MNNRYDVTPGYLSSRLAAQAEAVARELLPNGKRVGDEWKAGDTTGGEGKSLGVVIRGEKAGVWCDFATGESGDMLDLWCAARGLGLRHAMEEAAAFCGVQLRPSMEGGGRRQYRKPGDEDRKGVSQTRPNGLQFLKSRGLSDATIAAYKVAQKGSDTLVFPHMRDGECIHIKYRAIAEKKFWASAGTEPSLFGWQVVPDSARSVILTEGEIDAMTWFEYGQPALSIPFGGGTKGKQEWIENEFDHLARFDTIYLSLDADDVGQAALRDIVTRLGRHRCKVVRLPETFGEKPIKDINDLKQAGAPRDLVLRLYAAAESMDPVELHNVTVYRDEVVQEFYPPGNIERGIDMPWRKAEEKFRMRPAEVTLLAGYNGHGKSEGAGHIVLHALSTGHKACVASLEFKPKRWIKRLVRQALTEPQPPIQRIDDAIEWMGPKLWTFDVTGIAQVEQIIEVFKYAHRKYGVDLFVLDNFSKCGIAEDDYNGQKNAIQRMTEFVIEHDVHLLLVAHSRKTASEREQMDKMNVKGTGAITDLVDNVMLWFRNKAKEETVRKLEQEIKASEVSTNAEDREEASKLREKLAKAKAKGDAFALVEKQRNGDGEPKFALWFDLRSHQFLERPDERPTVYIPWRKA